jgi:hypothetical protein
VEFEQGGAQRAAYGVRLIPKLAQTLTQEFGRGFDERNLRHMRAFFQAFPIWNAVRTGKYRLVLPSEEELRSELEREKDELARLHLHRSHAAEKHPSAKPPARRKTR